IRFLVHPKSIQNLIKIFSQFPGIGPKAAQRIVFYLLSLSKQEIKEILTAIAQAKNKVKKCPQCFKTFENETMEFCEICSDKTRDKALLCVVEKEADLEKIEETNHFKGLYFILGNLFLNQEKKQILEKRVVFLLETIKKNQVKEIILGLNHLPEAKTTALFLERKLKPLNLKITHLAVGLALEAELEYASPETIEQALNNRY
ncbi:recombination protein RecR, partial [Candidatus Gribaldobacteria bacterium]|nr:recombination protein RecR [Candidatus Gribaldobacteria bacterium]